MSRLLNSASAVALATTLLASVSFAETQAEIAARENEEGKTLMFGGKYAEASAKFQDAVARVPEPKYFFNLCTSRFQEGKFGDALTACNAADKNADDKLKQKVSLMQGKIKEEADKQGIDLQPAGGGASPGETPPVGDPNQPPVVDPNNPNQPPPGPGPTGQPPQGYGVGAPPAAGLFQAQPVENKYVWTLGIDLFGGAGKIGQSGRYGEAASGFRLKSDYMLNPASRIGGQGYLQYTHFSEGEDMTGSGAYTLDVIDLGVAAYKHLCGRFSRGCLTPLAGVHFAMMSPQGETDAYGEQLFNYGGFGARLELGYQYALGSRFEHVLGVTASANVYTKAFAEPSDGSATAMDQGLDKGGASFIVALGYTYRFRTPFGSSPFVTLE
jgi:hypothetical protein